MPKYSDSLQSQLRAVRGVKPKEENTHSKESNVEVVDSNHDAMTVVSNLSNHLEATLGLRDKTALERFEENPCELTLRGIPKCDHTPEIMNMRDAGRTHAAVSLTAFRTEIQPARQRRSLR